MDDRNSYLILRIFIIWCVILLSDQCQQIYDPKTCTYDVSCIDNVDLNGLNYYIHDNVYDSFEHNLNYDCATSITYQNQLVHPIKLTVKELFFVDRSCENKLPKIHNNQEIIRSMLISLDLSNNNYNCFPKLYEMRNLVTLDLSKNSFDIARLTNENNIPVLKEIDLSHNRIKYIPRTDGLDRSSYLFEKLEFINLSYNNLSNVPEGVFDALNYLINLDLSHNHIDNLGPITFEGIKKLVHLNMSYNNISDINASLFRFSELKTLDLSGNLIKNVKANDFNALTKLTTLNLKSNKITAIEKDAFINLHVVHNLDISDNELELLDKDIFQNAYNLKKIIISKNKFKKLPKSMFQGKIIDSFSIVENSLEGSIERGTFEGLQLVTELDLSNQRLDSIEDNAFYGLKELVTLLLQNNNIRTLAPKCFNMLIYLRQLDLSNNKIINIEFEKESLGNLESLSIRNNYLTLVTHKHFQGLISLQYLDLSDNNISRLESKSFKSLKNLISFGISNNPLNGTLEENTFEGLNSLPTLDISCTSMATIQNGSFSGMTQLNNLNISHSQIQMIQFNSFIRTDAIEILDLSYNNIVNFNLNNTQISKLNTLYLNNNHIKTLDAQTFDQMIFLTTIILSYNQIETVNTFAFANQKNLRVLDVSNNPNLMFNESLIDITDNLYELNLSGTKTGITFGEINKLPLNHIIFSNASIVNITSLKLNGLKHLHSLELSHNNISKVDFECFTNITALTTLDLSHNKINYIQPGAFKDNSELRLLNISHNQLTALSYGIFRGLILLDTLDISFNGIDNLQNERFNELRSLSFLVADHNRIETFNAEEFLGTSLSKLSIGDNPIPCNLLVNFLQNSTHFEITAIKLDEKNSENVKGITCNRFKDTPDKIPGIPVAIDSENSNSILINIRDILYNKLNSNEHESTKSNYEEYLGNITSQISKINYESQIQLSNITKLASQIAARNETNILLEKILKVMTMNSLKRPTTAAPITKNNATYDNLVNYINKLKQQLDDTIAFEKNNILSEVDVKLSAFNKEPMTETVHEKFTANTPDSKPIFTETCVALILLILVCLVLYKFYNSGLFMRKRLSISTRELPEAMDSAL